VTQLPGTPMGKVHRFELQDAIIPGDLCDL
jgi:hypothetical protein